MIKVKDDMEFLHDAFSIVYRTNAFILILIYTYKMINKFYIFNSRYDDGLLFKYVQIIGYPVEVLKIGLHSDCFIYGIIFYYKLKNLRLILKGR